MKHKTFKVASFAFLLCLLFVWTPVLNNSAVEKVKTCTYLTTNVCLTKNQKVVVPPSNEYTANQEVVYETVPVALTALLQSLIFFAIYLVILAVRYCVFSSNGNSSGDIFIISLD